MGDILTAPEQKNVFLFTEVPSDSKNIPVPCDKLDFLRQYITLQYLSYTVACGGRLVQQVVSVLELPQHCQQQLQPHILHRHMDRSDVRRLHQPDAGGVILIVIIQITQRIDAQLFLIRRRNIDKIHLRIFRCIRNLFDDGTQLPSFLQEIYKQDGSHHIFTSGSQGVEGYFTGRLLLQGERRDGLPEP